jgi:outer membrane protein
MRRAERGRARGYRAGLLALAAALLAQTPLHGQGVDTVLTLSGARQLLALHNPDYRARLASADAAGEGVWRAWGSWLPTATLSGSFGRREFTTKSFVDPTGVPQELPDPITDVSKSVFQQVSFNWTVFRGGSRIFDVSASKASARAADLAAVARLTQLEAQLESQYFEALKRQELVRLARELLEARRRDLEITQARFRIAASTQSEVLQAQVQVGQNELALLQAGQAADQAKRELSVLVGLEESMEFELRDTAVIFDPAVLSVAELRSQARQSNPELARLDAEIDARSRTLWQERGSWLPTISLGYALGRSEELPGDASIFEFSPRNTSNSFSVNFSWPLVNGLEKKWRTGQASAQLQEARANKVSGLLEVEKSVRDAYDALLTAYRTVEIQMRNVQLARESVRLTTERYRIGAATYLELQQATSQATEAERGLIEARYDFMRAFADLQGAVGRPIAIPQS